MNCGAVVTDVVRHFGQGMVERSELSLSLLRAIDGTVDWLASIQNDASSAVAMGQGILKTLHECKREHALDESGKLRDLYVFVEGKIHEVVNMLQKKRDAAKRDQRIKGHRADLVAEFDAAIFAVSQLHDILVDLRWAVSEHDADLERPVDQAFSNAKDLFAALKV